MDNIECSPMISTYLTHAFKDKLSSIEQRPSGTGFPIQELQVSFFFLSSRSHLFEKSDLVG